MKHNQEASVIPLSQDRTYAQQKPQFKVNSIIRVRSVLLEFQIAFSLYRKDSTSNLSRQLHE
jgi:hypothetical protein